MKKTLTVEGELDNIDGIMFHRAVTANGRELLMATFYMELSTENITLLRASEIDETKPSKVTLAIEQDDEGR